MIKHFCILLLLAGTFSLMKAQDQLFKKDNSKLLVKITEISPDEIKYKLFSNLNGPTYVESKSQVILIIFENGKHEVISSQRPANETVPAAEYRRDYVSGMSRADSLLYFKYNESISLNFLSLVNMELGMIYQRDFLKSNFSVIIPMAIGIDGPALTQSIYYNNGSPRTILDRKLFEVGIGLNYYPSLRKAVNYYVGPVVRYMQYDATQVYNFNNYVGPGYQYQYTTINKNIILSRYCISVTNGIVMRTKSRLVFNIFGSLGFRNDVLSSQIVNPNTNLPVTDNSNNLSLYFWSGFNIGFTF